MKPGRMSRVLMLLLVCACATQDEPTVMRMVGSSPGIVAVSEWSVDGARDGAQTQARVSLTLSGGETLQMELLLAYDPRPVLAAGRWTAGEQSGTIQAESVRFVGGQGEGPSVGGDYVLVDGRGLPRFRVQIPLTPIRTPAPRPPGG